MRNRHVSVDLKVNSASMGLWIASPHKEKINQYRYEVSRYRFSLNTDDIHCLGLQLRVLRRFQSKFDMYPQVTKALVMTENHSLFMSYLFVILVWF